MIISQDIKRNWGISGLVLATVLTGGAIPARAAQAAASAQEGPERPVAANVPAADASGEIIVRAQRRDERLQDTPVSVTAVTADGFAKLNGRDLADISRAAPNIQFAGNQGGSGLGTLTIRGIGQQQAGLLSDPGAAVYVDDVYRPRLSNNTLSFNDIERLEVLRGPQGTLFGKNSIGGALSVYSPKPSFTYNSRETLEVGSRNLINVSAMVNVPVNDKVAVRFSAQSVRQDGYMHNLEDGEDYNNLSYRSVRGSLLFRPGSGFELVVRGDYTRQDQRGTGTKVIAASDPSLLTSGGYESRGTAASFNRGTDAGVSATATWDLGIGALKSISAYRWFSNDFADDTDGTSLALQAVQTFSQEKFISQELQYNVDLIGDNLHLTTGLFYINEKIKYDSFPRLAIFSLDNYSRQTTDSYAAFAQIDIKPVERLEVSLGLRYSRDEKNTSFVSYATGNPTPLIDANVDGSWGAFTPKATVQYKFSPDVMIYATVSRGFKSGGVNGQPIQTSDFQPFDQEMVTNYEAGIKTELFDRRVRANVSVFRMNYDNMQIGITAASQNVVKNAGKAAIQGLEGDFMVKPLSNLTLSSTFSYNDFKYTRLDDDAIASGLNYNLTLPMAPKWTVNAGAEYRIPLSEVNSLSVRGDYSYRSKIYFDANNSEILAQPGYGLVSSRITFDYDNAWSVYAYGNNITDKYFRASATTGLGTTVIIPGRPRELGIGASVRF
ncbi:TonB-dependent receptor [Novosphingobium sp. Rr 2-17]|uniref:TonB-dependent receptor n=1 Tax=Novosphingobium sp. Rr 2-17 TaxID=555793 RepID=UPI0002699C18|nr:TonB-dependent receptor [Novosphingobium sp. Rr 2-17]EIZ77383.1 TonB-dependent receptor [Novosphingobium sp. Rr 2-17]